MIFLCEIYKNKKTVCDQDRVLPEKQLILASSYMLPPDQYPMKNILTWIDTLPLPGLIFIALLLGLAPFTPEPHVWEKLKMLADGSLSKPIDIFDLFLHGTPWVILATKLVRLSGNFGARA